MKFFGSAFLITGIYLKVSTGEISELAIKNQIIGITMEIASARTQR